MKKILIINNDPDTMQLLHDLLKLKGFETKSIYDSKDVPGMLQSFEPSLLLVDINHEDVIDRLNDNAEKKPVPVLLMTGHERYKNENEAVKDVIKKPFTMDELSKKIEGILGEKI